MADNWERLEDKVDAILKDLPEIKADLREHIRRTSIAEERIDRQDARLRPIENAHYLWSLVGKVLLTCVTLASAILGLLKVLS